MVVPIAAHKIAYFAVPKAACSSVKAALALIDPEVDINQDTFSQDISLIHQTYRTWRFRHHRWPLYDGWYRFTVVRDPLKRLLSVYTDRVIERKELIASPKLRKQNTYTQTPDPDYFFQNLSAYRRLCSSIKHHALPTRIFTGPIPGKYDDVFTTSQMPALQQRLSELTQIEAVIPRFNASKQTLTLDDLSKKTKAVLAEELKADYTLLADHFEPPF